mgnify:CR=1 FL=1
MESIIYNGKEFKQYRHNHNYYVSSDGQVFSKFSQKIVKNVLRGKEKQYYCVDVYINGKQKHIPVHRMVCDTWIKNIDSTEQVNHKDDNALNNNINNLYVGTQQENIKDCVDNDYRIGNMFYLTVYDKQKDKILSFAPANSFINYCNHPNSNGAINKFFKRKWFKKRYNILEFKKVKNIEHLRGVTTTPDEYKEVGQILSLPEEHCIPEERYEEIV